MPQNLGYVEAQIVSCEYYGSRFLVEFGYSASDIDPKNPISLSPKRAWGNAEAEPLGPRHEEFNLQPLKV